MSFVGNFTLWRRVKNVISKAGKNISIKKGTISVIDNPVFNGKHLNNVIDNVDTNTQLITDVETGLNDVKTNKQDKLSGNSNITVNSISLPNKGWAIYQYGNNDTVIEGRDKVSLIRDYGGRMDLMDGGIFIEGKVMNVDTPTFDKDGANKLYVDSRDNIISGSVERLAGDVSTNTNNITTNTTNIANKISTYDIQNGTPMMAGFKSLGKDVWVVYFKGNYTNYETIIDNVEHIVSSDIRYNHTAEEWWNVPYYSGNNVITTFEDDATNTLKAKLVGYTTFGLKGVVYYTKRN